MRRPGASVTGAVAALLAAMPAYASTADDAAAADFRARASHPDVVRAVGFDRPEDVTEHVQPDGRLARSGGGWDSAVAASGAGSLRFVVSPGSGAGDAGSWRVNFSDPPFDEQFGEMEEFFVQWRQRFDTAFIDTIFETRGATGWKQVIIGEGDVPGRRARSCTELEIVVTDSGQRGLPQIYHSCGRARPWHERHGRHDYLLQNAVRPPCLYSRNRGPQARAEPPCVGYAPEEWMTFQVRVSLGPRGVADSPIHGPGVEGFTASVVQMWVAREGEASKLVHDWSNIVLLESRGREYGKVWFVPYLTRKDESQMHPVAHTWYDELIVSRSRIADPAPAPASADD